MPRIFSDHRTRERSWQFHTRRLQTDRLDRDSDTSFSFVTHGDMDHPATGYIGRQIGDG